MRTLPHAPVLRSFALLVFGLGVAPGALIARAAVTSTTQSDRPQRHKHRPDVASFGHQQKKYVETAAQRTPRRRSADVPPAVRRRSARDPNRFRTGSEPVPRRCRTAGAAPVPPPFRSESARVPANSPEAGRRKKWVFFSVHFGVFVLLGVFLCLLGGDFARRRRATHLPAFRTRSALCSHLLRTCLCRTCAALVPHLFRTCAALVPHLCRTCAALVPHLCRTCAALWAVGGSAARRPLPPPPPAARRNPAANTCRARTRRLQCKASIKWRGHQATAVGNSSTRMKRRCWLFLKHNKTSLLL